MDASSHRLLETGRFPRGVPSLASPTDPAGVTSAPFLISTPAVRNQRNSFRTNENSHSNRHSSGASAGSSVLTHFASRTTPLEDRCLHSNLLCYSSPVTRVPPIGLRASAPAGSHGCGVVVFLSRNVRSTGAFPHKINRLTGLMGPASSALAVLCANWLGGPFWLSGFRSLESPVDENVVKEKPCAS